MKAEVRIFMDGKELKELDIHFMGEDFVWFEGVTKDGKKIQTLPIKGNA